MLCVCMYPGFTIPAQNLFNFLTSSMKLYDFSDIVYQIAPLFEEMGK